MVACASDPGPRGEAPGSVAVRVPEPEGGAGDAGLGDSGPVDSGVLEDARVVSLAILAPEDGTVFARDDAAGPDRVARVEVRIAAEGLPRVELDVDGATVGVVEGETELVLREDGDHVLRARGLDAAGLEVLRDEVQIAVRPPDDGSCHAQLDALGVDWEPASPRRGITDPVLVQPEIGGVTYRTRSSARALVMDCELAPRLVQLSALLRDHGIDEAIHLGVYNYRCIGGGDPDVDDCTPSQHAYARAIDLYGFVLEGSDEEYLLERDWLIDEGHETCDEVDRAEPDRVLHALACAMYAERIFQIVLTPNYNAAHRNHFHVDLTAGSMFLGRRVVGVDPEHPGLGHPVDVGAFWPPR